MPDEIMLSQAHGHRNGSSSRDKGAVLNGELNCVQWKSDRISEATQQHTVQFMPDMHIYTVKQVSATRPAERD